MAFKTEEETIEGYTYRVTQLDAIKGRRAFTRLCKLLGPAVAAASSAKEDQSGGGMAIGAVLQGMSEEDLDYFCDLFAKSTSVSEVDSPKAPQLSDVFAAHFAGRYLEMVRWLIFAMKVNFSSFFGGAGGLLSQVAASASSSPTTSTGTSGGS